MGTTTDTTNSGITQLQELADANRAFQLKVMEVSVRMNVDNKLGQKAGDVGK
jgi:hypothetical protein